MNYKKAVLFFRKRLPTILTIVGALSGGAALFFTGKATVKAVRKYDELKKEGIEITPKVVIKHFVPYYIPAIGFAVGSLGCNISSDRIHAKRNRVLTLAATTAIESLRDFKQKAFDVIGEEGVRKIEKEQAKDAPVLKTDNYIDSAIRVYDIENGFKFETTYQALYEAESLVNRELAYNGFSKGIFYLRDFYKILGVCETKLANLTFAERKWDEYYMQEEWETNWVTFTHEELFDKDGMPMVILRYSPYPEYQFVIDEHAKECY